MHALIREVPQPLVPSAVALQSVIDALSAHIAVLDSEGSIVAVNRAWRRFSDENGAALADYGMGMSYLSLCNPDGNQDPAERLGECGRAYALRTYDGIRHVLAGRAEKYQLTYPCHSPTREQWYLLTVTALNSALGTGALVAHENVTTVKQHEVAVTRALMGTVETIAQILRARDPYTADHEQNVGRLAAAIGQAMGLDEAARRALVLGGQIHDIGKISIPAEILSHPGRLSDVAMSLVRTHAQAGYDLVKNIDFPWPLADIIRQHHERFDGSGYPSGLSGEGICLEARIVAVADVVDAMASHRPYRPARGLGVAAEEIHRGTASIYDPEVVAAFFSEPVQALAQAMYSHATAY
jgi:response regulator RpfG family c-di-GMP phosphodiesterase